MIVTASVLLTALAGPFAPTVTAHTKSDDFLREVLDARHPLHPGTGMAAFSLTESSIGLGSFDRYPVRRRSDRPRRSSNYPHRWSITPQFATAREASHILGWERLMLSPGTNLALTVRMESRTCGVDRAAGCFYGGLATPHVGIKRSKMFGPFAFYRGDGYNYGMRVLFHELGHDYAFWCVRNRQKNIFLRSVGVRNLHTRAEIERAWWDDSRGTPPSEKFAEVYAAAAFFPRDAFTANRGFYLSRGYKIRVNGARIRAMHELFGSVRRYWRKRDNRYC